MSYWYDPAPSIFPLNIQKENETGPKREEIEIGALVLHFSTDLTDLK